MRDIVMEHNLTAPQNGTAELTQGAMNQTLADHQTNRYNYPVFLMFWLISLLGLVLNTGAIYIIQYGRNVSREIKLQLTNLAVADLLFSLVVPVLAAFRVIKFPFIHSHTLCSLERFAIHTIKFSGPLWNLTISLERMVVICFPFRAVHYRKRHKVIVAVATWIFACVIHIDALIFAKLIRDPVTGTMSCWVVVTSSTDVNRLLAGVRCALPASIMTISSIVISYKIGCRKRIGETPSLQGKKVRQVSEVGHVFSSNTTQAILAGQLKRVFQ